MAVKVFYIVINVRENWLFFHHTDRFWHKVPAPQSYLHPACLIAAVKYSSTRLKGHLKSRPKSAANNIFYYNVTFIECPQGCSQFFFLNTEVISPSFLTHCHPVLESFYLIVKITSHYSVIIYFGLICAFTELCISCKFYCSLYKGRFNAIMLEAKFNQTVLTWSQQVNSQFEIWGQKFTSFVCLLYVFTQSAIMTPGMATLDCWSVVATLTQTEIFQQHTLHI